MADSKPGEEKRQPARIADSAAGGLSREDLAWEALRRNPAYREFADRYVPADRRIIRRSPLLEVIDAAIDEGAPSWGLRFRGKPR